MIPLWVVELIKKGFPHRFTLARLTRVPGLGRLMDHALFEGDDLIVLAKDQVIPIEQSVERPEETVVPSRVVEHFIRQANYLWIMDACICREAMHCRDYPRDLGCLFLGEAAMGINPKLGRRVSQAEALAHARKCREAGLVHLIGRNKLDTVWLGVGPGHKLMTICNCCPCCCLWRALPHLSPGISAKITRMPGVTVAVTERCTGCGICADQVCFADAIRLDGDRAVISEACRGCGRCVDVCPEQAIKLTVDPSRFVQGAIARLAPRVELS